MSHTRGEAMPNVSVHHQQLQYYQLQRIPITVWTAFVTWYTRLKVARIKMLRTFSLIWIVRLIHEACWFTFLLLLKINVNLFNRNQFSIYLHKFLVNPGLSFSFLIVYSIGKMFCFVLFFSFIYFFFQCKSLFLFLKSQNVRIIRKTLKPNRHWMTAHNSQIV